MPFHLRDCFLSEVFATDISSDALAVAQSNALAQGLETRVSFLVSDWFSELDGTFRPSWRGPPYLTETELKQAEPEVREHEPTSALVTDGDLGENVLVVFFKMRISF